MEPSVLSLQQALDQIQEDLGIAGDGGGGDEPQKLLERAAQDLGVQLPGRGLRRDAEYVCIELGIDTHWGWTPTDTTLAMGGDEVVEAELSHEAKMRSIFDKFDEDGDGKLNFREASAYSLAKEGEALDEAMWAEVCDALGVDSAHGMSLSDFERMYDSSTLGEVNDINVDYMRLCEGLRITTSSAPISYETPLIVRIARTERSDDGKEDLYVVEVMEEFDDCMPCRASFVLCRGLI